MNAKSLRNIGDLFDQDLAGWCVSDAFVLELRTGLAGQFLAVTGDERAIVVLDKALLERVWKRLPRRHAKITQLRVLAHRESHVAFDMELNLYGRGAMPLTFYDEATIDKLETVQWRPGLFGGTNEPFDDPVFKP